MNIGKNIVVCLLLLLCSELALGQKNRTAIPKKRHALDQIMIPAVALDDHTMTEAVAFVLSRAIELDFLELDPKRKGVSISIRLPGKIHPPPEYADAELPESIDEITITYQARQITLAELLIEIARRSGFDVYTTSVGIVFCPPGESPFPNSFGKDGEIWEDLYKVPEGK